MSCLKAAHQHGVQVGALYSGGESTREAEKEDGAADEGGDTEESGASGRPRARQGSMTQPE